MSEFKSDKDGFLVGEPIIDIKRSSSPIDRIRIDVAAIKNAVIGSNKISSSLSKAISNQNDIISSSVARSVSTKNKAPTKTAIPTRDRDLSGRFVKGSGANKSTSSIDSAGLSRAFSFQNDKRIDKKNHDYDYKLFDGLGNKLALAVTATKDGLEDVDPTIKAMHEVATPLIRGYQILAGDGKQKSSNKWFGRIFKELNLFRKTNSSFSKIANETLKDIDNKSSSTDSGSSALMAVAIPLIAGAMAKFMPLSFTDALRKNETIDKTITAISDGMTWLTSKNETLDKAITWLTSKNETLDKIITGISTIGDDVKKAISDVFDPIKKWVGDKLGIAFDVVKENVKDTSNHIKANTGIDVPRSVSSAIDKASGYVSKVMGFTGNNIIQDFINNKLVQPLLAVYKKMSESSMSTGVSKIIKTGGSRSWRNNNPGNIEYGDFAKKHGAIGSDGRFAIFPSYEAGRKAKESLIFDGKGYKNKTLVDAIRKYAPPSENNTGNYQAQVLSAVGGKNKVMSDYSSEERSQIMDAMQRIEGFKSGNIKILESAKIPSILEIKTASTQSYSPKTPKINATIKSAPIQDSPFIMDQLNTPKKQPQQTVSIDYGDVRQDVSDRRIAHILTGGHSGG